MADEAAEKADLILRNGRVLDPASDLDFIGDLAVLDSRIIGIGQKLDLASKTEFDATGCLVTPGLIDCHIHGYQYATPLGINVDSACLSRGVTAVVDAGSSGASTFLGLKKFIAERSRTRVFAFLHIASHGLAAAGCSGGGGGECESLHVVDVDQCVKCIKENPDVLVGVKVRLSTDVTNKGQYEEEAYRRALEASRRAGVPLMIHHTFSSIPVQRSDSTGMACPGDMRPGDIYTHTYHGFPSSIIDPVKRTVWSDVWEARRRGVLFDAGHGQGSFNWAVTELAVKEGLWPDIISTDLHSGNLNGPAYDLPTVMTKFLHLGMPLPEVIRATTSVPAKAIGKADEIGCLAVGREADITVLKLEDCDVSLEDCNGQYRNVKSRLRPVAVWRAGKRFETTEPTPWPCPEKVNANPDIDSSVLIKDER